MIGRRIKLFSLLGFPVRVDLSWLIIAVLVTWSLAVDVFAPRYPELSAQTRWLMGILGMLGLFLSIIVHEFSHSIVARRFGMPMKGITLFVFGGVAEMGDEPPNGRAELLMALAGPAASVVVALVCFALSGLGARNDWPPTIRGVLGYLGWINLVLVAFNLMPAFPLDGGRVLRAALWTWKGRLQWATRISSRIGAGFGVLLIVLGVVAFVTGNFISGMWWFVIGMFVRNAARGSYQQLVIRQALEGETVERLMRRDPVTVSPEVTIQQLVEDYIYAHHYKMFPVVDGDRVLGCVTTRRIREVPRAEWSRLAVRDVLQACSPANSVAPHEDAMHAMSTMTRSRSSRLLVIDDGRLVGVLSLKDLMRFLSLKIELGDEPEPEQHRV